MASPMQRGSRGWRAWWRGLVDRWQAPRRAREWAAAQAQFHRDRERLELRFLTQAAESGRPRGLRWVNIDFANDVTYVRSVAGGELQALVPCTISFEAIEGGGMEHVEAVGNLRAATAVFRHLQGAWLSEGRVLFNLSPQEALNFYRDALRPIDEPKQA